MKTPARKLATVRNTMRQRRAAHQAELALERDLALYDSPADRRELDAILSRYTAEQTSEINRILGKQAIRRPNSTHPPR